MSELRRLKMKIGNAEFEADVAEDEVQPMYDQFLSMLGHEDRTPKRAGSVEHFDRAYDRRALMRIFDLHEDGAVVLKVLPVGHDRETDALLLLLYGYRLLKSEECVMATHLFRAAKKSGISLRRPVYLYVRNSRFVIRNGQRKGSNYALNGDGLAMAKEITARILGKAPTPGTKADN
jgi:hypothetical protein